MKESAARHRATNKPLGKPTAHKRENLNDQQTYEKRLRASLVTQWL